MAAGFPRNVEEMCVLLGHYAALGGNSVPTFQDNLSVPSSRVQNSAGLIKTNVSHYIITGTVIGWGWGGGNCFTLLPYSYPVPPRPSYRASKKLKK